MTPALRARLLALKKTWEARYEECRAAEMRAFTNQDLTWGRLCYLEGSAVYRCLDEFKSVLAALLPSEGTASAPVNAHTLTLEFHRLLSESEWRTVVEAVRHAPYVQSLRANAVVEAALLQPVGQEPPT